MPAGSSNPESPDEALSFGELAQARADLNKLVLGHRESVHYFASDRGFRRLSADVSDSTAAEPPDIRNLDVGEKVKGITTSLTCFESLQEAPPSAEAKVADRDSERLQAFVDSALDHPDDWRSEGAARRYCIVRGAGPILRADGLELAPARRSALVALLREVWDVVGDDPETRGIYEDTLAARPPVLVASEVTGSSPGAGDVGAGASTTAPAPTPVPPPEYRYPPNAFLTYWALRGLLGLTELSSDPALAHQSSIADAWIFGVVGREIALHYDDATSTDPQQLAWALCGVVIGRETSLAERTDGALDLVRAGLRAFFDQQLDDGTWELGRALFHYPEAGNAYCYVFETLAELLAISLDRSHPAAAELRAELRPYLGNLLKARDHLARTARTLGPALRGWSSNHHPHRTVPESWATATVYRFLELLRRLVGIEVRRRALAELNAVAPKASLVTLRKQGQTWDAGQGAAGDLVASLFVHPSHAFDVEGSPIDPDRTLFDDTRARSAMLFGPPGTGKTVMAEAVAGALGWEFVEITPADFLDRGMELVSARADEIFKRVMELDHCVVLFDEIDELIRSRTSSADPLERFFTTTMLPRLARLWKSGRTIFFVNTNSVADVDPAVRRSQRFDAAIFVMPPSLERKLSLLPDAVRSFVDVSVIGKVLEKYDEKVDVVGEEDARLGWFPFLRYDQTLRLADAASEDREEFLDQIARFGRELLFSDWALSIEQSLRADPGDEKLNDLQRLVKAYKVAASFQRLDSGRLRIVRRAAEGEPPAALVDCGAEGYFRWNEGSVGADAVRLNGAGEWVGTA